MLLESLAAGLGYLISETQILSHITEWLIVGRSAPDEQPLPSPVMTEIRPHEPLWSDPITHRLVTPPPGRLMIFNENRRNSVPVVAVVFDEGPHYGAVSWLVSTYETPIELGLPANAPAILFARLTSDRLMLADFRFTGTVDPLSALLQLIPQRPGAPRRGPCARGELDARGGKRVRPFKLVLRAPGRRRTSTAVPPRRVRFRSSQCILLRRFAHRPVSFHVLAAHALLVGPDHQNAKFVLTTAGGPLPVRMARTVRRHTARGIEDVEFSRSLGTTKMVRRRRPGSQVLLLAGKGASHEGFKCGRRRDGVGSSGSPRRVWLRRSDR
jgi:hypothetical protein